MDNNFNNMPPNYNYNDEPMTIGEWLLTIFITSIPCVGLIMLFVWGFGNGNKSRSNYCKAMLIWELIALVILIVIYVIFFAAGAAALRNSGF